MALTDILTILNAIINLEKRIEEEIENEKDMHRREALAKAFKERDLDSLRKLLFAL